MFLREIKRVRHSARPRWLLLSDFNMIYPEQDKNNDRLNMRLMARFRRTLNQMEFKEVELVVRKYTWRNNQSNPTLTCIDRAFCSTPWEDFFHYPVLLPLSSSISDHYPLLLTQLNTPNIRPIFRFESLWTHIPGFLDCVQNAWNMQVPDNQNPMGVLHIKLGRTAKALKTWSKIVIPHEKLVAASCRGVVDQLERAQENRTLTSQEHSLIKLLKSRILGLNVSQETGQGRNLGYPD
jgi:hypothetical protein